MILQRLVEHYDRLAADPDDPATPPGFSREKISFELVLAPDGSSAELGDLRERRGEAPAPRVMTVPDRGGRSGRGLKPNFLWDNTGYVLGRGGTGKAGRSRLAFESFRDFHREMAGRIDDPGLAAVATFLAGWSPDRARAFRLPPEAIDKNVVFRIRGRPDFVHQSPAVARAWGAPAGDGGVVGQSLISGDRGPLARLHPLISGVAGAQATGAAIASFNLPAFTSYGREQTYNAPVTVTEAFKYTTALNRLLEDRARRTRWGDATVVFWAERPTPLEAWFGDLPPPGPDAPPEDLARAAEGRRSLARLRDGPAAGTAADPDADVGFYVLGLSPNAARLSVRFWVQSTVGGVEARLRQHLRDTDLVGARPDDPPVVIRRIVDATGRARFSNGTFRGYDADGVPPLLAGATARAVLQGTPYPAMLLGQLLNGIRADGYVSHVRVAAIKACLVRRFRQDSRPTEVGVSLNASRADPAYVTGRVFALLEKIHADSVGGDLSATIKDRYFAAASATPAAVLPRLLRLSQHHLARMDTGLKLHRERLLGEAIGMLDGFPARLGLEGQGLFAVGYYHQRQDLFTPKKTAQEGDAR